MRNRLLVGVAVSVASAAMLACVAAALAGSATKAQKLKSPITILATSSINSQLYSGPQWTDTAVVFADYVNAHGGLDGHSLHIDTCDNTYTLAGTATCANEAVTDKAVAMTGLGLPSTTFFQTLDAASIPWVPASATTAIEFSDPGSFPINIGGQYQAAAQVAQALKDKCTSVTIMIGSTVASRATLQQQELAAQGISNVNIVTVPGTATDMTPYVTQSAGAQCLIQASSSLTQLDEFGTALTETGVHFQHIISTATLTNAVTDVQRGVWPGAQVATFIAYQSSPVWATYEAAVSKYGDLGGFNNTQAPYGTSAGVWSAMAILANAITYVAQHHHGVVTATSVTAALNSNHSWSADGTQPPVNFSKSLGVAGAPRLVAPFGYFWVVSSNNTMQPEYKNQSINLLPIILNEKDTNKFFNS